MTEESKMDAFQWNCKQVRNAQEEQLTDVDEIFFCDLFRYLMDLDYNKLLLDTIKEGCLEFTIAHYGKLNLLSYDKRQLCKHAIFKALQEQYMVDQDMLFKDWYITGTNSQTLLYCKMEPTKWSMILSPYYLAKQWNGQKNIIKELPQNAFFISDNKYHCSCTKNKSYE